MTDHEILEFLEETISEVGYDCVLEPDSEEIPYETLLVYLAKDHKERDRILQITCQSQEMGADLSESPIPEMARVQYELSLPIEIADTAYHELSSMLLFLNRLLELPGFELDEMKGIVLFRYPLMTALDAAPKELYISILGLIIAELELFSEAIEKIATGEVTFNQMLEEILKAAETIGSAS